MGVTGSAGKSSGTQSLIKEGMISDEEYQQKVAELASSGQLVGLTTADPKSPQCQLASQRTFP